MRAITIAETVENSMAEILSELPVYDPEYSLKIGWVENYDQLARHNIVSKSDEGSLISIAFDEGLVLLHANAGSGKSAVLSRLFRKAASENTATVLVSFGAKTLEPSFFSEIHVSSAITKVQQLIQSAGKPIIDVHQVYRAGMRILLLIDGLNEISAVEAENILEVLERFADLVPSCGVVVADRFTVRNRGKEGRWKLATLEPLTLNELKNTHNLGLLGESTTPLIADLVTKFDLDDQGSSLSVELTLETILNEKFSGTEIASLERVSFVQYRDFHSIVFDSNFIASELGRGTFDRAISSKLLRYLDKGSLVGFYHQIVHDYLAARYISKNQELWCAESFDALSFRGSSFDAIALCLGILGRKEGGSTYTSDFLEKVYDWNFYASAFSISRMSSLDPSWQDNSTAFAVLATMAERRWDIFLETRKRVIDALRLVSTEHAQTLINFDDRSELLDYVSSIVYEDERFRAWKNVFTNSPTDQDHYLVHELSVADSVVGWAASNVLKRPGVDTNVFIDVQDLLQRSTSDAVRWRCVHALGAYADDSTMSLLLSCLDNDSYSWVKYGSLRSIFEIAWRSGDLTDIRDTAFRELTVRADALLEDARLADELARCVMVIDPSKDWRRLCRSLLTEVWDKKNTLGHRERWQTIINQIEVESIA